MAWSGVAGEGAVGQAFQPAVVGQASLPASSEGSGRLESPPYGGRQECLPHGSIVRRPGAKSSGPLVFPRPPGTIKGRPRPPPREGPHAAALGLLADRRQLAGRQQLAFLPRPAAAAAARPAAALHGRSSGGGAGPPLDAAGRLDR